MANRIGELELNDAARHAAGNWKRFDSFVWYRDDIEDAENCAIIYTHNRDSGLLDQSNSRVIAKALEPFTDGDTPDVVMESHNHWAVGHVDGFSVRVFKDGEITPAFRKYHELAEAIACYAILDDEGYSRLEYEATIENLADCAWRLKDEYDLPDDWRYEVYSWLSDNDCGEIENTNDQGGSPSEESLRNAFTALGYGNADAAPV